MSPAVSVLMPVYNAQRYIASAVQSILGQTFTDFELIIVDDGSTDRSREILRGFAARDPRVKLISRPNTGYVVALNEALATATGEFIARMDADDMSLPYRFERQVEYLRAHPDCVLVGTHVVTMDSDGSLIGVMPDIAFGHQRIDDALLRRGWPIVHPAVMMRARALREIGGYKVEYCPNEDHDLFLRLAEFGQIENLPEVLIHYRKHAASVSAMNNDRMTANVGKIIVEACRRRGVPVPPEVAQTQPRPQLRTADVQRVWAWMAMKNHNIRTARKYALATLCRRPLSMDSWRLTFCAVRGH
ncbi:MAG TPA: glycosyltransferase [Tepidisphaeraceae bacterium]|nr:glycosyltransferase [Tepidisphaeraceae bacterium]